MKTIKNSATENMVAKCKTLNNMSVVERFKGKSVHVLKLMTEDEAWLRKNGIMIDAFLVTGISGKSHVICKKRILVEGPDNAISYSDYLRIRRNIISFNNINENE